MVDRLVNVLSVRNPVSVSLEEKFLRALFMILVALAALFPLLTLHQITWDVPSHLGWDGCLYTDEGFYSGDAITYVLEGSYHIDKEYNQYINLPVLQWIQGFCFKIFGLSLLTVRLINWVFTLSWLGVVYLLFRRFIDWQWAFAAVVLVAYNHVTFAMTRMALAEIPMATFGMLAFLFAVHAHGPRAYVMAALSALSFSIAVLTKTNVMFMAPALALTMIFVDLRWKPVLLKFLLCTVIFGAIIGTYYALVIAPNIEEFKYFFSLNVGLSASLDPTHLRFALVGIGNALKVGEPILVTLFPYLIVVFLLFAQGRRFHPLFWMLNGIYIFYFFLYVYYGRIYPRFFTVSFPLLYGVSVVVAWCFWQVRDKFFYLAYGMVLVLLCSLGLNVYKVVQYKLNAKNSYNEMAAEIKEIIDNDPDGNRIVLGHHSAALSLRIGTIPRHDRYGLTPIEERLRLFRPGWYVSETVMRGAPRETYFIEREWIQRYFEMKLIARYNIMDNYRGYPATLYKLIPREDQLRAVTNETRSTRRAIADENE